jgi:hypothetical protein
VNGAAFFRRHLQAYPADVVGIAGLEPEDAMSFTKTSIAAVTAVGFVAAAASASACDWYKQALAKASTPQAEEQTDVSATPIDPVILARTGSGEESEQIEQK